jgi:predicted DNA-binding transcriptional regulator AlpA
MQEERQPLRYPSESIPIHFHWRWLDLVDAVLLAERNRMRERLRDLLPYGEMEIRPWLPSLDELRTSRLGQELLCLADYAHGGWVSVEIVQGALQRVLRMLYGDPFSTDGYRLPDHFQDSALGQLFQEATHRLYTADDLMTAAQAYRLLGVARQTLYDRVYKGKLTPLSWFGGELRFLRSEIETWKAQRDQRQSLSKQNPEA